MADGIFTPSAEVTADLDRLESVMKRLTVEYEMFLTQQTKWPPHQRLAEANAIIRHYAKHTPRRTVDRFRYNTLTHRFHTAMERWSRRLRAIEEKGAQKRLYGSKEARQAEQEALDISKPQVLAATRLNSGDANGEQLRDFYLSYKQARKARGMSISGLQYSSFADSIERALQQAREKAAGGDLELRVDEVGGKVRISVRTLRTSESKS